MNLEIINNLINNIRQSDFTKKFMKELSNYMEEIINNSLKKEDNLYQVVEILSNGAYLQNLSDKRISKETDIPKDLLKQIGNDSILRYKNGEYIYEEKLTDDFYNNLQDINE